jgi:hypothetical protein
MVDGGWEMGDGVVDRVAIATNRVILTRELCRFPPPSSPLNYSRPRSFAIGQKGGPRSEDIRHVDAWSPQMKSRTRTDYEDEGDGRGVINWAGGVWVMGRTGWWRGG